MAKGDLPAIRTERFIHRDSDGPVIVGRGMHQAVDLGHVYDEVKQAIEEGLAPLLPNTFLYRGLAGRAGQMVKLAPVGELITDRGFFSATLINHVEVVEELKGLDDPVLLIVRVPEETQALPLWQMAGEELAHELEVVVQCSTTFLITKKTDRGDLTVVDAVVAYQPDTPPPAAGSGNQDAAAAASNLEAAIRKSRLPRIQVQIEWTDEEDATS